MTLLEPLLMSDESCYCMFPVKYEDVWAMYKKAVDSFWRAEEIDLSKDAKDFDSLTGPEQHFVKHILAFFASSDGIVSENLATRFYQEIQNSEVRAFYSMQLFIETIHSETYSLLIDTYVKDAAEKSRLFSAISTIPCVAQKAKWARKWIMDAEASFATRLVAFAVVEGIFFSGAFASIYWLKKRGLMPGLTLSNEFISRDEAMHCEFAICLYNKLERPLTKRVAHMLIKEAVLIEQEFITESLPCRLIGMNAGLMNQYIEYVADRLAVQLGYDRIFGSANPFDFIELISLESKANFFERPVSQYALATIEINPFNLNSDF